jgi:malonyl-CoA/methylmalonyl-CoA synthetase
MNPLFHALTQAFPADLSATAIECPASGEADALPYRWQDLLDGSAMMANLLQSLPVQVGDRVLVQVEKSVEALMLHLAILRAGLVHVPLNTAYQSAEMQHFVNDARPKVVVCAGAHFGWMGPLAFNAGAHSVFTLNTDRTGTLLSRAAFHARQQEEVDVSPEALACIIYTSGTTGRSKGAMLSHANLLSNARTLYRAWGWSARDVLIHALPLFHVHGLFVAAQGALLAGAKMLWFNKFEPQEVLQTLPRATVFMGVPTLYTRLLAQPGLSPDACANMRLFISGSAPLLKETFDTWQQRTGHTILERYGMSETVMLTSNPYRASEGERKGGTVGRPLPEVQVRVVKAGGAPCGNDEVGDIQVRGPSVFAGYWQMPEKTAEEFTADGWFKTGDVGSFDADGFLRISGRSKDLIISGGFNVYPAEVEGYLNALPGVLESAVIGLPHPDFGEAVAAVVVPRPGFEPPSDWPTSLMQSLRGQVAAFKCPKAVFVQADLPRNAMGKVQKNVLRQVHQAHFD